MRARSWLFAFAFITVVGGGISVADAAPPGYVPVEGSPDAALNPGQQGAQGSTFPNQSCSGVPDPPGPGEVVWHFVLPQAVLEGPTPANIFDTLTVTFQEAGTVSLMATESFGPPSLAHAYITTATDDVLLSGQADIYELAGPPRGPEPFFNLSHTCVGPPPDTTTTTDPATPTTTPAGSTSTTSPSITTTTATGGSGSATTSTTAPRLPATGANPTLAVAALVVAALGVALAVAGGRRSTTP